MMLQTQVPKNTVYPVKQSQVKPTNPSVVNVTEQKTGAEYRVIDTEMPEELDQMPSKDYQPKTQEITMNKSTQKSTQKKTSDEVNIEFSQIKNAQNKVIQSGYESRKEYQTRVITTPFDSNGKYVMPKSMEEKPEMIEPLPTERVNKFKTQWKSGYESQANVDAINGVQKLELKEVTMPELIIQRGYWSNIAYSNSNGHNGYNKLNLIRQTGGREVAFD